MSEFTQAPLDPLAIRESFEPVREIADPPTRDGTDARVT